MTDDWGRAVERRIGSLETKKAVDDVHRLNVEVRLSAIEDTLKWLVRLVVGALVTAAVAFAITGGLSLN